MTSLGKNVVWAFVANGVSTALAWAMLLALTKMASPEVVGLFALSQAVALPIHMFFTFKLRGVQATDHDSEFSDDKYRHFRILSAVASLFVTAAISLLLYSGESLLLITIMSLSYAIVLYREFYIAVLQKHERNDLVARSNFVQGSASLLLFLLGFAATKRLWVGISGIAIARLVVTLIYDRHLCRNLVARGAMRLTEALRNAGYRKRLAGLLGIGVPLGGVALLGTLFTSIPRLVLEKFVSLEAVGYYAALASLLGVLNLFVSSFGQSITPRLARLYSDRRGEFLRKFTVFFLVSMTVVVVLVVLSYLFSAPLLTFLFSSAYAAYSATFFKLMIAGALLAAFSLMNIALTAQRAFAVQLPIYLACSAVIFVTCILLVPRYGIDGAVYASAVCNLVGFLLCAGVFVRNARAEGPVALR